MTKPSNARRDFVKKAAYVTPAILTLAATPSYAKFGSDKQIVDPANAGTSANTMLSRYSQLHRTATPNASSGGNVGSTVNGGTIAQAPTPQMHIESSRYAAYNARHQFVTIGTRRTY